MVKNTTHPILDFSCKTYPFFVGFDSILTDILTFMETPSTSIGYPPYDIIKTNDKNFVIKMAVAGFSKDELDIELKGNKLTIKGNKTIKTESDSYIYNGISNRNFERTFTLANSIEIGSVTLDDGLLIICLYNNISEDKVPKKIKIN